MSERIESGEIPPSTVTGERADSNAHPNSNGLDPSSEEGVRERSAAPTMCQDHQDRAQRPAHRSNRRLAQLNESWRVVDDPLQWILQRRKGNPRDKSSGWRGRSFCRTRDALLRCVREQCGEIDANSLAVLKALPDWHPDWDRRNHRANLDVRGTDQAQADGQSEPLPAQGLEACEADDQRPRSSQSALT